MARHLFHHQPGKQQVQSIQLGNNVSKTG